MVEKVTVPWYSTRLLVLIYTSTNIIKIFQTVKKLWSAQEYGLEIRSGEIARKRTKQGLSFLYGTIL